MSKGCTSLHKLFNNLPRFYFPFDKTKIPLNGIYILFENGETGHDLDRIVRIGTHTGANQLRSRLHQHYILENKDRSIFRKNIGRAILNKRSDPYLKIWQIDFTTRNKKAEFGHLSNQEYQSQIESEVSNYIQNNFSFCVFGVDGTGKRLELESKLISTVSACKECRPSNNWLGSYSSVEKIRLSGLWQVNELYNLALSIDDLNYLISFLK
jgi:Fe-S cluster assembly iron-binding protein IscA